jgi:hypothetical protein
VGGGPGVHVVVTSATTASSRSARRPVTSTLAPSTANIRATAAPTPVPPPVALARRLPPGLAKDLATVMPACVTTARRLRRDPRVPRRVKVVVASADVRIARRGVDQYALTTDLVPGRLTVQLDDDGNGTFVVVEVLVELEDGSRTVSVDSLLSDSASLLGVPEAGADPTWRIGPSR